MMGAGGAGFTLNLYGYDLKTGLDWAKQIKEGLSSVQGLKDLIAAMGRVGDKIAALDQETEAVELP